MFEGKHIHFSPTDNKPLCSFSGKLCRQRRLNGYAFCIRHILEDKSSPFKQCSYVTRNNSQKCLNAIPTSQDRGYCHSHMQVAGIIPKTERKSKSAPKGDNNSSSGGGAGEKSLKKDPGAVFKFEEESSDITDVFSYKNGTINGKGKVSKLSFASSQKDTKTGKVGNGSFTTKKITDKNKNVYTAIIPTGKSKQESNSKSKTPVWSSLPEAPSVFAPSTTQKAFALGAESELKSLQDDDSIRQFEQLKTLKQLDKSCLLSPAVVSSAEQAKSQVFPRLALKNSEQEDKMPSEIASSPPLITRSNNSIIIKTDSQLHGGDSADSRKNFDKTSECGGAEEPENTSVSMEAKSRHQFLAHVRHSFKSQYKSIRKACKFNEDCEQSGKRKLRDSLIRCVRIDSSICAQVLVGCGIKLPSLSEIKSSPESVKGQEYDDYDFVDNEGSLKTEGEGKKSKGKLGGGKAPQKRAKKGKDSSDAGESLTTTEPTSQIKAIMATSKRKLKRSDAVFESPDGKTNDLNSKLGKAVNGSKKTKLDKEATRLETELGLVLSEENSSQEERRSDTSAGRQLNGHAHEFHDILGSSGPNHRNQGLETVLNSVGSSENAGTPDGVITDASFDSTFEHSTSSQPDCEFSEDDLEHSFELQMDPEIESQASRLLEDNVLTEADFTELFPDNRICDPKFGRNDLQELGMTGLEFDVNDIDYALFANIFPNLPRTSHPESISISNQF